MATRQPGAWGIDIGQAALKALRLENINGVITATAFDYVEHPKILSQPDADPDLLTREALEKFLSRNSIAGDAVCMSVSGQSGLARFVKLPPVEERKIGDIVKFEAKQQIPFPLEEVVWDFQKIGSGVVTDGFAMETEIGLFAIKRESVTRALQHFQEVNVEVDIIQMSPLALCNYVAFDLLNKTPTSAPAEEKAKKECVVALDIGVESANLVITDGERVIWQRPIGIGGNRFTRALTKDMKLTFAKAEHLKKNATKSPDLKRILLALRNDLNEFVNEVQKSLAFFMNNHRDTQIKYLVGMGGAFRLPGLQKYLQEKLGLDVRKLSKFSKLRGDSVITAPVFNDNVMSMGVVYGLALQGLKMSRLHTNLLPQEIRMDRLVRSKKPWAVAAAACLLLGIGAAAFGLRLEHDAFASPQITSLTDRGGAARRALDEAEQRNKDFAARKSTVDALKREIRSVVAGQEERLNWIKLQKFVNECLPRPDGKVNKVADEQLQKKLEEKMAVFLDKEGGRAAYNKYLARQSAGKNEAMAAASEEGLDDLLQINIESLNALYTDDLGGFFRNLKVASPDLDGMPEEEKKTPPTGAGWVVEVRGYTYNRLQRGFVAETFVDNLINRSRAAKPSADDPIGGKVSHVCLYKYKWVQNAMAGRFDLIENSDLYVLVHGAPPGRNLDRNQPPPSGPGAAAGAAPLAASNRIREGWKPLGMAVNDYVARDAFVVGAEGAAPKGERGQNIRTEFIVLFAWQEPTFDEDVAPAAPVKPGTPKPR